MSADSLPAALRSLILHHMPSMDHVAVVLVMRADPGALHDRADIVQRTRLDRDVVERALRDLVSSQLLQRAGDTFRYAPASELVTTIDELAEMYRTKPVSLGRALYDRPARAVQSFADAFRLRRPGD